MLETIATGKTIEEATENACKKLNLPEDQVSIEILEMPVRKLFKSIPAKVKAMAIQTDTSLPEVSVSDEIVDTVLEEVNEPDIAKPTISMLKTIQGEEINLDENPRLKKASDYLYSIFNSLDIEQLEVETKTEERAVYFNVTGENINDKIVIDSEVMHAFSYLLERLVNSREVLREDFLYVRLDIDGYRERRQEELLRLAQQYAEQVLKTKRSFTFPPMNSYERLIIHTYIGDIDGLESESKGVSTERRVVIRSTAPDATEGADWKPPYQNKDFKKSNARFNNRKRKRNVYHQNTSSDVPENKVEDKQDDPNNDVPLYGKIEL